MVKHRLLRLFTILLFLLPLRGEVIERSANFVSECANVISLKNTVEEYIKAVKSRVRRGSKEYMQIEDDYSRASQAYGEFVRSLETEKGSTARASEAALDTNAFIDRCKLVLRIDHLTDLEEPRYSAFASAFFAAAQQRRKTLRADWIRTIQHEIEWLPWDRVK